MVKARSKDRRKHGGLLAALSSFVRTITVGSGIAPDLLTPFHGERSARGLPSATWDTAGGDLHPALRISL